MGAADYEDLPWDQRVDGEVHTDGIRAGHAPAVPLFDTEEFTG